MRIVAGLLALCCLAGCAEKDRIPSGIIPPDEMQKIFWDMVQADQYADLYLVKNTAPKEGAPKDSVGSGGTITPGTRQDTVNGKRDSVVWGGRDTARARRNLEREKTAMETKKMETLRLYAEIFELHHVSREDFIRSFQFYLNRPDLTRGLLDSALEIGNHIRQEAIAKGPKPAAPAHTISPAPQPVRPLFNPGVPGSIPPGAHGPIPPGAHGPGYPWGRKPYIPPRPGGGAPNNPGQGGHPPPTIHHTPPPAKHRPATHVSADSTHAAPSAPPAKN